MMKLYICLLTSFLFGCNVSEKQSVNVLDVMIDTVYIPIDENYLDTYTVYASVNNDILYGKNRKNSTLDIIDLKNRKAVKNIPIHSDGPNAIPLWEAFCVMGDTIIIDGRFEYLLMDTDGSILQRIRKDELKMDMKYPDYTLNTVKSVVLNNFQQCVFDKNKKQFIFPIFYKNVKTVKERYSRPFIGKLDLINDSVKLLPVDYPEELKKGAYYGNLDDVQITIKGDSLIYNFPYSSTIYIYDKLSNGVKDIVVNSDYTENKAPKLEVEADRSHIMEHYVHSLFFHEVVYDRYRHLFYRIHVSETHGNKVFEDREMYLVVMDEQLNKIDEIQIPTTLYPIFHITKEGILFSFLKSENDDYLSYVIMKFGNYGDWQEIDNQICNDKTVEKTQIRKSDDTEKKEMVEKDIKELSDDEFLLHENVSVNLIREFVAKKLEYDKKVVGAENCIVEMLLLYDSCGTVTNNRIILGCNNKVLEEEALRVVGLIKKVKTNKEGGMGFPIVFKAAKSE